MNLLNEGFMCYCSSETKHSFNTLSFLQQVFPLNPKANVKALCTPRRRNMRVNTPNINDCFLCVIKQGDIKVDGGKKEQKKTTTCLSEDMIFSTKQQ